MAYDNRFEEPRGNWRHEHDRSGREDGRERFARDPGAGSDYYRGGEYGQRRLGPEGGFEERGDFRRDDRHAEQGQAYRGDRNDRDEQQSQRWPERSQGGARTNVFGGGERQGAQQQRQGQNRYGNDPHYTNWRQQQIAAFDRDYDEYRQENASRFAAEFGTWRDKRGQQRGAMGRVTEHMEVVGSDDAHVGTVDKVKDGRIILTRTDPDAGGHHHSIPCGWLETVDDKVRLNKDAEAAKRAWRDEETSRALFESRDSGSDGPHILERSFSGTYRDER